MAKVESSRKRCVRIEDVDETIWRAAQNYIQLPIRPGKPLERTILAIESLLRQGLAKQRDFIDEYPANVIFPYQLLSESDIPVGQR